MTRQSAASEDEASRLAPGSQTRARPFWTAIRITVGRAGPTEPKYANSLAAKQASTSRQLEETTSVRVKRLCWRCTHAVSVEWGRQLEGSVRKNEVNSSHLSCDWGERSAPLMRLEVIEKRCDQGIASISSIQS